jgi:hypothetical protein
LDAKERSDADVRFREMERRRQSTDILRGCSRVLDSKHNIFEQLDVKGFVEVEQRGRHSGSAVLIPQAHTEITE